jgi:hypothetical protein
MFVSKLYCGMDRSQKIFSVSPTLERTAYKMSAGEDDMVQEKETMPSK